MARRFEGTRVLVTGATRGIGAAVSAGFAAEGAQLVLSARSAEELAEVRDRLAREHGGRVLTVAADLADAAEVERLAAEAWDAAGGLDVLVNNAGVSTPEPVTQLTVQAWDDTLAVNLRAPALLAARIGSRMADAGGGRIVNLASAAALRPLEEHLAYGAGKAALLMVTRTLALELGPRGVQAIALCPTVVLTEMGARVWGEPEKADPLLAQIPNRRFADPEEVVAAVLHLASPEAAMLNGAVVPLDGGHSAV